MSIKSSEWMCVALNEDDAYYVMKIAAMYRLHAAYKIGVYGKERQHEVYISGKRGCYRRFLRELSKEKSNVKH